MRHRRAVKETVGSYEAKTQLPRLLARVADGETITITKHGVPVAVLAPVSPQELIDVDDAVTGLREFRAQHPLDISIRELIDEGRG
jgi:prevent-host-death family protein